MVRIISFKKIFFFTLIMIGLGTPLTLTYASGDKTILKAGCEGKNGGSCFILAKNYLEKGKLKEANNYFKKGCELKHTLSCNSVDKSKDEILSSPEMEIPKESEEDKKETTSSFDQSNFETNEVKLDINPEEEKEALEKLKETYGDFKKDDETLLDEDKEEQPEKTDEMSNYGNEMKGQVQPQENNIPTMAPPPPPPPTMQYPMDGGTNEAPTPQMENPIEIPSAGGTSEASTH